LGRRSSLGVFWTAQWVHANPIIASIAALVAYVAASIFGPIVWYHEIMRMICGPDPFKVHTRKSRRRVRVRIQRFAEGST
jgi:hypothetical protein